MRYLPLELALVAGLVMLASSSVAVPPERIPPAPARPPRGVASGPDGKLVKPVAPKASMLSRISRWFGASKARPPAAPNVKAPINPVQTAGVGRLNDSAQSQPLGEGEQMTAYEFWALERDERNPR